MHALSMEDIFEWGSDTGGEAWTDVHFAEEQTHVHLNIKIRPYHAGGLLVRFESHIGGLVDRSLADLFPLPEMLEQGNESFKSLAALEVHETYGPADVEAVITSVSQSSRNYLKAGALLEGSTTASRVDTDSDMRVRMAVRHSYPTPDAAMLAIAPLCRSGHSNVPVCRKGELSANLKHTRPHPSSEDTAIFTRTTFWSSDTFPAWALPQLRLLQDHDLRMFNVFHGPNLSKLRVPCIRNYALLNIRSCQRGRPLMLVTEEALGSECADTTLVTKDGHVSHWRRWPGAFQLAAYLQILQESDESIPRFDVYNTFCGGQRLVPYLAAVNRSQWEIAEESFNKMFARSRAAYRRLNGGTGAPKLQEVFEPRYTSHESAIVKNGKLSQDYEFEPDEVVVQRTFISVAPRGMNGPPRRSQHALNRLGQEFEASDQYASREWWTRGENTDASQTWRQLL